MFLLFAFALQAVWTPNKASPSESAEAAATFVEACLQGSLKLTKDRGRLLRADEGTSFKRYFNWIGRPTNIRIIKLFRPEDTYLFLVDFAEKRSTGIVRSCVLKSRNLNLDDARRAFAVGSEGKRPVEILGGGYLYGLRLDLPKLGYRKYLYVNDDRTVELEYSTYASSTK